MKENPRSPANRLIALGVILAVIFSAFALRLADMQLIRPENWVRDLNPTNQRTAVVTATRGEILDRYGRPLSVNREGYNLVIDGAAMPPAKLNATLKTLVDLLKATGEPWRDNLPLNEDGTAFVDEKENASRIAALKKRLELNSYATAENCRDAMIERYKLSRHTQEYRRILMGIRYTMESEDYNVTSRYVFAEDISLETTLKIKETPEPLTGVDIDVVPVREYAAPDIAPHLLGMVGPIQQKDWETNRETYLAKGYRLSDKKGNSGMELAMEDYLRGTDGKKLITTDAAGRVISVETVREPVAGNTVVLTLDSRLQKASQDALASVIAEMKKSNPKDASKIVGAGAAVVINVNTGEILAAANYPSYNLNDYLKNAAKLNSDSKNRPLFNRAFFGGYPTGSTFKPATALVGLQTEAISASDVLRCTGHINYLGQKFRCYGGTAHGRVNLVSALSKSCNIYFFDVAQKVGINNLNRYCRLFGLGVATGVETGEYTGILAGPEYRAAQKLPWNPGDTLQAAIGQSDNSLTMLQLAVYTSTLANYGIRYKAHLTKEVRSYDLKNTVFEYEPVVLNTTGIEKRHYDSVKKGMLSVTEEGTARNIFAKYPVKIAGKTGTAENHTGYDHSVFIGFAPYDDPEIAVAVILEQALKGYTASMVAKKIFDAYFFPKIETYTPAPVGELLD